MLCDLTIPTKDNQRFATRNHSIEAFDVGSSDQLDNGAKTPPIHPKVGRVSLCVPANHFVQFRPNDK
jgi:hypothetical protein